MGRGYIQYRLPATGRDVWVLFSAFYNYRMPDGSLLSVNQQPAWCPQCGDFVLGECIQSVEQMEQRARELRNASEELLASHRFLDLRSDSFAKVCQSPIASP
jgi:hypothetical protein